VPGQLFRVVAYGFSLILAIVVSLCAASGSFYAIPWMLSASVILVVTLILLARSSGTLRYQWPVPVLSVLALAGLVLTGVMITLSGDVSSDNPLVDRTCRADGQFNACQQAFQSRWAYVRIGVGPQAPRIPSVMLGAAFYSTLLVWFLVVGRPAPSERWCHLIPLAMTLVASGAAAFFILIMFTRLAGPCHLCIASHIITFLLLIVTAAAWPRCSQAATVSVETGGAPSIVLPTPGGSEPPSAPPLAWYAGSWHRPLTTLFAAGVLVLLAFQFRLNQSLQQSLNQQSRYTQQIVDDPNFMRWDLDRQPVLSMGTGEGDSVRGFQAAPFTVVTYSDFQCPMCKVLNDRLEEVQKKYPGKVRVVYRHFPLDRSCNRRVKTYMHAFSCQAARAAEAARLLGGDEAFWKMHDAIFAHQSELDVRPYAKLAGQIGLNPGKFLEEMNGPRALQRIRAQIDGSASYDVSSTPAVFLNGRQVRSWNSMAFWQAILEGPSTRPVPTTTRASVP
jgi:protein-disulfide isomerase/uncharacterized membrane protein